MRKVKLPAALIAAVAILLRPEAAAAGAQRAMRVWFASVAPSLFPFLVLLPLLTGEDARAAYDFLFGRIMRPVFRLPGSAASAMIVGMLSGSPGGAIAASGIAAQGAISAADAKRLAYAVCGLSPAFLIFGVGGAMFGSVRIGVRFAAAQIAAQLLLLFALRNVEFEDAAILETSYETLPPVRAAVETVLCICGYMTFFSAMAGVVSTFLPESVAQLLLLAADLPGGLNALAISDLRGKMLISGAAIGFGGICVGMQNLDALKPVGAKAKEYFAVRFCAACICACFCAAISVTEGSSFASPARSAYAVSLLTALLIGIPILIRVTNQQLINNRKRAYIGGFCGKTPIYGG